jgi:hypothetical protein
MTVVLAGKSAVAASILDRLYPHQKKILLSLQDFAKGRDRFLISYPRLPGRNTILNIIRNELPYDEQIRDTWASYTDTQEGEQVKIPGARRTRLRRSLFAMWSESRLRPGLG